MTITIHHIKSSHHNFEVIVNVNRLYIQQYHDDYVTSYNLSKSNTVSILVMTVSFLGKDIVKS